MTGDKTTFFDHIAYTPSEMQASVHNSDSRFRILAAGARAGKSMLAGAEVAWLLLQPDKRIWICGTQYELAEKEFGWTVDFLYRIKTRNRPLLNWCKVATSAKGSKEIITPWGSFVRTKSTEKPQTLLGEELDLLVLSEASQIAKKPYERMLRARLGPRKGRLLAISTPNSDAGLFNELYATAQRNEDGDWACWQFSTLANPYFSRLEWETAKKELPEGIFKEQYEGQFVSRRGKIFDIDFNKLVYNEEALDFDIRHCTVMVGLQRGYKNPFAIVFVAITNSGDKYVFDAVLQEELNMQDAANIIKERLVGFSRVSGCLADLWDYDLVLRMSKDFGLPTVVNDNEKKIGKQMATIRRIQTLQKDLNYSQDLSSSMPVTRINSKCKTMLEAFERAKWPEKKDEEKEILETEIPNSKYLQAPLAYSHILCFLDEAQGGDPYRIN